MRDIKELKPETSVYRELVLIKVKTGPEQRQGVISVADIFRAKIIDVSAESLIIELTGNLAKVDAFLSLLEGYESLREQEPPVLEGERIILHIFPNQRNS